MNAVDQSKLPDRKRIAMHYLPGINEMENKQILEQMASIQCFATTIHLWTSQAKYAYTGLTIQYITEDYLQCYLLDTKDFPDSHSTKRLQRS